MLGCITHDQLLTSVTPVRSHSSLANHWLRAQPCANGHHSNPCFSVNVWTGGIVVTIDNGPMISTSISPRVRIPCSANSKIGYTTNYNTLHVCKVRTIHYKICTIHYKIRTIHYKVQYTVMK